eukprot:2567514-Ditylum_brightwellii.AAC.1
MGCVLCVISKIGKCPKIQKNGSSINPVLHGKKWNFGGNRAEGKAAFMRMMERQKNPSSFPLNGA